MHQVEGDAYLIEDYEQIPDCCEDLLRTKKLLIKRMPKDTLINVG